MGASLKGLQNKHCVLITGESGEDKTTIAHEAVRTLLKRNVVPGGVYQTRFPGQCNTIR